MRWGPGYTAKQGFNIKNCVRYEISRKVGRPKMTISASAGPRGRECSGLEHCCSRVFQIGFNRPTLAAARYIGLGIDAGHRECVPRECHVLEAQEEVRMCGKLPGPARSTHQ
jgi:hypothetical protein